MNVYIQLHTITIICLTHFFFFFVTCAFIRITREKRTCTVGKYNPSTIPKLFLRVCMSGIKRNDVTVGVSATITQTSHEMYIHQYASERWMFRVHGVLFFEIDIAQSYHRGLYTHRAVEGKFSTRHRVRVTKERKNARDCTSLEHRSN